MLGFERKQEIKGTLRLRKDPPPAPPPVPVAAPVSVPVEKRSSDGIVNVTVILPSGNIELKFRKRHILSNAHTSQLTKANFERALCNALEPLLGRVEVL